MASVSGIYRAIIVPYGNAEQGQFDEQGLLSKIATLVASTANVLVAGTGINYYPFEAFSAGAFHFGRGIKIELLETTAGDAVIVANLPAFQTSLGVGIVTWSEPITFGF